MPDPNGMWRNCLRGSAVPHSASGPQEFGHLLAPASYGKARFGVEHAFCLTPAEASHSATVVVLCFAIVCVCVCMRACLCICMCVCLSVCGRWGDLVFPRCSQGTANLQQTVFFRGEDVASTSKPNCTRGTFRRTETEHRRGCRGPLEAEVELSAKRMP